MLTDTVNENVYIEDNMDSLRYIGYIKTTSSIYGIAQDREQIIQVRINPDYS